MATPRLVVLLLLLVALAAAKPSTEGGSPVGEAPPAADDAGVMGAAEAAAESAAEADTDALQDAGATGELAYQGAAGEMRPPATHQRPRVNPNEEPCLSQGGLCVRADECPEGNLNPQRGLCPSQRDQGVECCHGLSVQERRCSARGGVCRPKRKCGRALWDNRATDCGNEEICCILV